MADVSSVSSGSMMFGGEGDDSIYVGVGDNYLDGGEGNDVLVAGTGNDTLVGDLGKDTLTGGGGADRFCFNAPAESPLGPDGDVITDFSSSEHDLIDLHGIDADTRVAGDQKFTFIGNETFADYMAGHPGAAGLLRFTDGVIEGDVNGDGAADFAIRVTGVATMTETDFVL